MSSVKDRVEENMRSPKKKNVERLNAYYKKLKEKGEIRGAFD
jgi:hypothetical protein